MFSISICLNEFTCNRTGIFPVRKHKHWPHPNLDLFKSKTRNVHSYLTKTHHWTGLDFLYRTLEPQYQHCWTDSCVIPRTLFFRIPLAEFSHQTKTSAHYPLNRRNSISSPPLLEPVVLAARSSPWHFIYCLFLTMIINELNGWCELRYLSLWHSKRWQIRTAWWGVNRFVHINKCGDDGLGRGW